MSDIRLKKITVDSNSLTIPLTIQQGNVYISSTTNSADPFQGALTVSSIGVSSTADTTSSSSGGAMSIAGGLSVMKSINVGSDINIDGISGKLKVSGLSINRLFLDNVSNRYFYISPDGINKSFEINNGSVNINTTMDSIDSSTGALVIIGGCSINTTVNATSYTSGGALTIGGGGAFSSDLFVGGNTNVNGNLNVNGDIFFNEDILLNKINNDLQIINSIGKN